MPTQQADMVVDFFFMVVRLFVYAQRGSLHNILWNRVQIEIVLRFFIGMDIHGKYVDDLKVGCNLKLSFNGAKI